MDSDFGAYERAGAGGIATESELENKFATYDNLKDPNPERTEAMKEHIKKIEAEKAELLPHDPAAPSEKGGLLSKLRRGSKDKNEASSGDADELHSTTSKPPAEPNQEHITLVKQGSDPEAPPLVVKEH